MFFILNKRLPYPSRPKKSGNPKVAVGKVKDGETLV